MSALPRFFGSFPGGFPGGSRRGPSGNLPAPRPARHTHRRAAAAVAAASLALALAACGQAGEAGSGGDGQDDLRIGLLLPENQTARYEAFDRPFLVQNIKDRCPRCTVDYANAGDDVNLQRQQVNAMITTGVDVLVLDAVDSRSLRTGVMAAADAGIPVVAYDRDVEGPVSALVAFDGVKFGRLLGQALIDGLNERDDGRAEGARERLIARIDGPSIPGSTSDAERGAEPVLKGKARLSETYRAEAWNVEKANSAMSAAITELGPNRIDAVWASNDVIAAGAISALRAARVDPMPVVVGGDAELSAVRNMVRGDQYATIYKPYRTQAAVAARMALALGRGESVEPFAKDRVSNSTTKDIPAVLLDPVTVTVDNIEETVVKDGLYTVDRICAPTVRAACERAGLVEG